MKYFTADWHLGDDRFGINGKPNLLNRPFDSVEHQHEVILGNIKRVFKDGDTLVHLGDVLYDRQYETILHELRVLYPNSHFLLLVGNYDEDKLDILGLYFDEIVNDRNVVIGDTDFYLNHYPINCLHQNHINTVKNKPIQPCLTGHIHGLWKVQRNIINVGIDTWHFRLVSESDVLFTWTAMQKFYDSNVFPY